MPLMVQETPSVPFRLGTFSHDGGSRFAGMVCDSVVLPVEAGADHLSRLGTPITGSESILALLENWDRNFPLLREVAALLAEGHDLREKSLPLDALAIHPPVDLPRQIFCSGANYRNHVIELIMAQPPDETLDMTVDERRAFAERRMDNRAAHGTPFCFVKAQSSVTGPFDPVYVPKGVTTADWELELAVVIGRRARHVQIEEALDYVAGYTIANDITSRERLLREPGDMRNLGHDWTAAKCAPSYLPLGPYLTPAAFVKDPQQLQIMLRLNGDLMQDGSTSDMIFGVSRLVEYLSSIVVLLPGDVICTGSPAGNGTHFGRFLRQDDVLDGEITGLGRQRNVCLMEENQNNSSRNT